jgi:hypothetical protein
LRARRLRRSDPFASDLHLLVFTYLVSFTVAIYFGSDLNDPMVWFILTLGVLTSRLVPPEPVPGLSPILPVRSNGHNGGSREPASVESAV